MGILPTFNYEISTLYPHWRWSSHCIHAHTYYEFPHYHTHTFPHSQLLPSLTLHSHFIHIYLARHMENLFTSIALANCIYSHGECIYSHLLYLQNFGGGFTFTVFFHIYCSYLYCIHMANLFIHIYCTYRLMVFAIIVFTHIYCIYFYSHVGIHSYCCSHLLLSHLL